ncbi:MAG: hypothetical protein AC479_07335 [miscellaneous Crenarchaeota group-6 archaeon AD8-1]|nr:MAG: hypothetical protein AC479_07335 [miscellaneous Crenarchaeota group-6 archaeon AD8-1]
MGKAADIAKISARGGFHLAWGLAASTIITSIGVIILARLLSPSDFGLYTIALTIPNLIQYFRDWGTSYATVKYSAYYKSKDNYLKVKEIIFSGLIFQAVLSIVLTLITFLLSDFLAITVFQRPSIVHLIQVVSLSLLSSAFVTLVQTKAGISTSAAQAAFIGLEKTEYNSLVLLFLSIIRTILTSTFVIVGLGAFGATIGYSLSLVLAGATSLLLILIIFKELPKSSFKEIKLIENLKFMFRYGFPLSVVSIVRGFTLQFYLVLLAIYASDQLIGNYSVATNFVVLITFLAVPIVTILYPAFSKLDAKNDWQDLRSVFRFSVKYGSLLVIPATFLVIGLSEPIIYTIFGSQYDSSPLFLSLLAITYLLSAFGFLTVNNFLNGQGQTVLNMKLTLLSSLIGLPLGYFLISYFEVLGLIVAMFVAEIPSLVIGLYWIWRNYGFSIDWTSSFKILFSSGIGAILAFFVVSSIGFVDWVNLLVGLFVFVGLFLLVSLLIRVVDRDDLGNLRDMTRGLGSLYRVLVLFFDFYERLIVVFKLE